jgi:hypothetical protein
MLLASLALAFLLGPQAAAAADDGPVKTWENVDVLRRMLVRQIGSKHDEISAAPRRDDDKDADGDAEVITSRDGRVVKTNRRPDGGAGAPPNTPDKSMDTVAGAFTRARNNTFYESSLASNGSYAPGLGAIVSATVPVRVHLVTAEPKSADAKKPAETKSADDEAWERLARGEDGSVDRRVEMLLGPDGKAKERPRRELRYDDDAVKALKETVVDTVARFGGRLGLVHGERLAIVVTLSIGSLVRDEDGGEGGEKKGKPAKGEVVSGDAVLEQRSGVADYMYFDAAAANTLVFDGRTAAVGRRFVLQVSGDDLRAHKSGDLDRDELVRKIRIEEFTLPASSSNGSNRLDWFRSPK